MTRIQIAASSQLSKLAERRAKAGGISFKEALQAVGRENLVLSELYSGDATGKPDYQKQLVTKIVEQVKRRMEERNIDQATALNEVKAELGDLYNLMQTSPADWYPTDTSATLVASVMRGGRS